MKKSTKQAMIAVVALVGALAIAIGCWAAFGPKAIQGTKNLQVTVVVEEGKKNVHDIKTEAEFLGEALTQEKIIEGEQGPYGLYIKVADGVAANEAMQQWWCITKEGADVMTGVDSTPIADGDKFEITLKTGY
ncbi:MAG: DUF4430 domain-containing protein [Angelakisella sp.]|nr:DUF4430 domain-containing protein [Angelakisella sp.]